MTTTTISLKTFGDVQEFVNILMKFAFDIDLVLEIMI